MPWEAFLLGLSSGTYCAASCAPVALPLFASRPAGGRPYARSAALVGLFLGGRLIGYLVVGAALGAVGAYAVSYVDPALSHALSRIVFAITGAIMVGAGLAESQSRTRACAVARKIWRPGLGALLFGLLTGGSICPPFLVAAARVFGTAAGGPQPAVGGALYFLFFFLGTSVWILPLVGLPALLGRSRIPRFVARSAMIMIGVYFLLVVGLLGTA